MKRALFLLVAAVCGLGLLVGCNNDKNLPSAFYSFVMTGDNPSVIKLGMSNNDLPGVWGINATSPKQNFAIDYIWEDTKTRENIIALVSTGKVFRTMAGLSLNNTMADVLPMYQKDTAITVAVNEPKKIVLQKQIDGVNYAMTIRGYDDGAIKSITVYNADLYNDDDKNYQ